MGWENPPVPWRGFEQRLSWRRQPRPVTRLPTGPGRPGPGDPDPGDPGSGDPGSGDPGSGDPGSGDLGSGDPGSGDLGSGEAPWAGPDLDRPQWAELHCHSSYSFLDGASSPADLVAEAARLGLAALAITDHDGMYGTAQSPRAAARLRAGAGTGAGLRTVFGAELSLGLAAQPAAGRGGRARRASR